MAKTWTVASVMAAAFAAEDGIKLVELGRHPKGERKWLKCVSYMDTTRGGSEARAQCFAFYLTYEPTEMSDTAVNFEEVSVVLESQKALTPKPPTKKQARKKKLKCLNACVKRAAKLAKAEQKAAKRLQKVEAKEAKAKAKAEAKAVRKETKLAA